MRWMLMPLRCYRDFNGRSTRREFWMFRLFFYLVLAAFILLAIAGLPWAGLVNEYDARELIAAPQDMLTPLFWVGVAGAGLWYLGCIVPSIAVCVRRLHDQDKTGWLWLLYFIPYVGWLAVVVLACLDGTRGPNRYGADPKDPGSTSVFE